MTAVLLAILSAIAGLLGGWLALSKRIKPNLTLGFTAGALIGLAAFGLLPEIFELYESASLGIIWPMIALVVGFLLLHVIEKSILVHHSDEGSYPTHAHHYGGLASASALVGHSFLDGMSIALAFQVSGTLGATVAIAVIGHRFADGFNIANLSLRGSKNRSTAIKMVAAGAIAPVLGAVAASFFTIGSDALMIYLGFFAGLVLYIGASDILPQAHSRGSSYKTIAATIAGAAAMFAISILG